MSTWYPNGYDEVHDEDNYVMVGSSLPYMINAVKQNER